MVRLRRRHALPFIAATAIGSLALSQLSQPALALAMPTEPSAAQVENAQPTPNDVGGQWPVPVAIFGSAGVLLMIGWIDQRNKGRADNAELAMRDELTGLANRRRLDDDLTLASPDFPVAVAMIDVDQLQALNGRVGHRAGDDVLRTIAAVIATNVRVDDVAYRHGGDEFCVLLPGAGEAEAATVVDRVRCRIAEIDFSEILEFDESVTVSVGVSADSQALGTENMDRADTALNIAKREGRNQVVRYGGE